MSNPSSTSEPKILKAKKGTVVIRMYRAGFGDCFLLAFAGRNNKTKYMLIDCGVHHQYGGKEKLLAKIAADIQTATGGHIDVLVVTHEHTDHILGFSVARTVFEKIRIDHVWMSWLENYNDPRVKDLDKKKSLYLQGLKAAAGRLQGIDQGYSERLKSMLGFYDESLFAASSSGKRMTNRQTMMWLQEKAGNGPTFCTPGQAPMGIDGVDGLRVFVLGPPTNEALLKKDTPSRGRKKETYLTDGPTELFDSFVDSMLAMDGAVLRERDPDDAAVMSPFAEIYGKKGADAKTWIYNDLYSPNKNDWRKIDQEWWDVASELAIRMDNDTNNSSLVLAIELGKGGKVLLFPGDAQVGNWLSWQQVEWKLDQESVKADDLLARTVVYKTGHHCSHNATLKQQGLEKMLSPELSALIPVDEAFANDKQGWKIPHKALLERLKEKCANRVLRADDEVGKVRKKPDELSDGHWRGFQRRVGDKAAYIDFTVKW